MRRSIPLFACVLAVACVERAPELSPADRERLREYVSNEAPHPQHELGVQFENGVRLLGYDLEQGTTEGAPRPEQWVQVTWYWHADEDLDDVWQLFTHVAKADGENASNQDAAGVVRELYQPGRWESGQYIRDVQRVTVPADWSSDRMVFYVGIWSRSNDLRLRIRSGPNDGDNRVRGPSVEIGAAAAQPQGAEGAGQPAEGVQAQRQPAPVQPPPSAVAMRAAGAMTMDGELDEPSWQQAPRTQPFVSTVDGTNADIRASARLLWDDTNMYVAFEVADRFISNTIEERDGHLWEQDAVEIMVDPDGDGANYFEMQVSPTNVVFDTRYDTRRQPQPFGDVAWNSRISSHVRVRGTANDEGPDQGYIAEIAIPWAAFRAGRPPAARPEADGTWRVNFYVMDKRQGGAMASAGWSPTHEGDFHVPARFGTVRFQGEQQAAAEPAEAPAAEQPAAQQPGQPDVNARTLRLPPRALEAIRNRMRPAGPRPNQLGEEAVP